MDLVVRAPHIPRPGETVLGGALSMVPGGKGANQAVAAARLGAKATMVGRVGCDGFGDALLASLAVDGIDHAHVLRDDGAATGVALIVVAADGENSIVVSPGANQRLSPASAGAAGHAIAGADVVVLQLEVPLDTVTRAAELARKHGAMVILNPAPARPLPASLLGMVDVLVPNESEAALLAGLPPGSRGGAATAAELLVGQGVRTVVLTLGRRGTLAAHSGEMLHIPAFEVEPVDTTAAGDAFVAGLAVALAEGKTLPGAVRFGNAAGALATTVPGAQTSLPPRAAVEQLLDRA
jgi:ribokinase